MAIVPILQIVFFYMAIGGNPIGLKLGVVDDEIMNYDECFNSSLITTFVHDDTCDLHKISCRFLHELNDSIAIKQYYKSYDEALADAKKGKIFGFMYFSRNFTESFNAVQEGGRFTDDGSAENSRIHIRMDQSDLQLTFFTQARLYQTYKQFTQHMMADCDLPIKLGTIPVSFEEPIYGSFEADFKHSMAPPMIMGEFWKIFILSPSLTVTSIPVMMFYIASGLTVAIFIADRKEGFWNRTLLAGVTLKELMLVHVLTHSVILIVQLLETILLVAFVFGAENKGSNLAVIFLLMMLAYSGMFFGILLSVECNDLREANFVLTGIATPMVVLAGGFIKLLLPRREIYCDDDFRNVLADSRHAVVPSVPVVLHAVHVLVHRRPEHHDEGLLVLPPNRPSRIRCGDALGGVRHPYRTHRTAQEEIQSEHMSGLCRMLHWKRKYIYEYFKPQI